MIELSKKYNHLETENKWKDYWDKEKIYVFNREDNKTPIYTIDSPPPTISGKLHMGHAYGGAQMDFFARYKKFKGYNVLHPFGTDDNGLATQKLIEKIKNIKATKMNREEFIALCHETLDKELREDYIQKFKSIGISVDWSFYYSTIDDDSRKISQKSFINIFNQGRIYRMDAPTMWCTNCQTAVAQVDLEDIEIKSLFNDIIFKTEEGQDLIIATTRPELLASCVALFYNGDDKRYSHLKGKQAIVPLFNYKVPILEDSKAEIEKGTGLVMCCTFGDITDVEWQKIHNLPIRESISKDGFLTETAGKYQGLKVIEARKKIIDDLKENNLIVNQKPISHAVKCHERCKEAIEFVKSKQWFLKYLDMREEMLSWAEQFKWFPDFYKHRYSNWIKGLNWDWCISRQIPFGIPFPLWNCQECGQTILATEEMLPVDPIYTKPPTLKCPKCNSENISAEKDVMTTWATSSLTPTLVKEKLKGHKTYQLIRDNPMDLRTQGHDIISFWLFNTLVKSKLEEKMVPWKMVFINGWLLGTDGRKMSKSLNNGVEPTDILEKFGADALRYMAGTCKPGQDLSYPEKELVVGQKTIVKLFNSTKFALIHLKEYTPKKEDLLENQKIDVYLINRLNKTIESVDKHLEEYEYSKALAEINSFFWKDLCDNYIEIVKDRLYNPDRRGDLEKKSAQYTLYKSFVEIIKLYGIYMPFIAEELYQAYFIEFEKEKSVHLLKFPEKVNVIKDDFETSQEILKVISAVRNFKSGNGLSLKTEIKKIAIKTERDYSGYIDDLKAVTIACEIERCKTLETKNYEYDALEMEIII